VFITKEMSVEQRNIIGMKALLPVQHGHSKYAVIWLFQRGLRNWNDLN